MIVYRVENKNGVGPYDGTSDGSLWQTRDHVEPSHPGPKDDGIDFERGEDYCGFASFEQLRDWFESEELVMLRKLGFRVRRISVPRSRVKFGKKQVVFRR
jgi:hypothetical protein